MFCIADPQNHASVYAGLAVIARERKASVRTLALMTGSATETRAAVSNALVHWRRGTWLLVFGSATCTACSQLLQALLTSEGIKPEARIIFVLPEDQLSALPDAVLRISSVVRMDQEHSVKSVMLSAFDELQQRGTLDLVSNAAWRPALYALTLMHAVLQVRPRQLWDGKPVFALDDLLLAASLLQGHITLQETVNRRGPSIVWSVMRSLAST